jgi:predicted metallo-beta-lactamase superfamily hydrolase
MITEKIIFSSFPQASSHVKSPKFIYELAATVVKAYGHMKSKKSTDCFLLMQRYVDNDMEKSIDCLNGIIDAAISGKIEF